MTRGEWAGYLTAVVAGYLLASILLSAATLVSMTFFVEPGAWSFSKQQKAALLAIVIPAAILLAPAVVIACLGRKIKTCRP